MPGWVAAFAAACGTPTTLRSPPSPSAPRDLGPAASAQPPAPPAPVVPAPRVRVGPVAPPACVFDLDWLPDDETTPLRLRQGGAPFVQVGIGAPSRVEIPVGQELSDVFVRRSTQGWHFAGHLDAEAFSLRPSRVAVMQSFLLPTELTKLRLVSASRDELMLTLEPPPAIKLAAPLRPERYGCDGVTLEQPQQLDAESALPGNPRARQRGFVGQTLVPLSVEPASPPVAWLLRTDEPEEVQVLERRGADARIALTSYTTLVFGWVPAADVKRAPPRHEAYGTGGLGLAPGAGAASASAPTAAAAAADDVTSYRCGADLPLVVSVGGELVEVGRIERGTRVSVARPEGGFRRVVPPRSVTVLAGASFVVAETGLAACEPSAVDAPAP